MLSKIITNPFSIQDGSTLHTVALETFQFQAGNVPVYSDFVKKSGIYPASVERIEEIPFLPVGFFKTHEVITQGISSPFIFMSSGTGGDRSRHFVTDIRMYEQSFLKGFELFYGNPENYCILALLPSYLEQGNSSLVYMVNSLIKHSEKNGSGYYLHNAEELAFKISEKEKKGERVLLIGVTYALLDFAEKFPAKLNHAIVMETGGMKGRRKEMIREEVHEFLCSRLGVKNIHSEYGMTELLSQAYSKGEGKFYCPPWMKVMARDLHDPLAYVESGAVGALNIIDLANFHSCSFIATQDIGRVYEDGSFEVLGRMDNSELRGCNLMVS